MAYVVKLARVQIFFGQSVICGCFELFHAVYHPNDLRSQVFARIDRPDCLAVPIDVVLHPLDVCVLVFWQQSLEFLDQADDGGASLVKDFLVSLVKSVPELLVQIFLVYYALEDELAEQDEAAIALESSKLVHF